MYSLPSPPTACANTLHVPPTLDNAVCSTNNHTTAPTSTKCTPMITATAMDPLLRTTTFATMKNALSPTVASSNCYI